MPRKLREIRRLEFSADEPSRLVASMDQLAAAEDGWINLTPKSGGDDDGPAALGFFTLFGGGGTGVTMCTWIPGRGDHSGRNQPSVGITHTVGRRVVAHLNSLGLALPPSWFVEQDHPRRGLVVRVAAEESNEEVLAWALRAITALKAAGPIRGWRADIHLPTTP